LDRLLVASRVFLLLLLDSTVGKRLRRQETSGLFLDLLDTILECGAPVEETLISIIEKRQLAPAAKFHLLGAKLRTGQRLSAALAEIPGLLPQKVVAMLRAGERIGDLRKVLPACRRLAGDKRSETRSDVQSLRLVWYLHHPRDPSGCSSSSPSFILPKFVEIFHG
jgi:type II secretory pathway component PulF